jgi:hypothetical protein
VSAPHGLRKVRFLYAEGVYGGPAVGRQTHLLRLLQEIPLGEAQQAAVEDGVTAYENLLSKLADVPTPAGPTPRQIGAELVQITSFRQVAMPVAQEGGAKVYG